MDKDSLFMTTLSSIILLVVSIGIKAFIGTEHYLNYTVSVVLILIALANIFMITYMRLAKRYVDIIIANLLLLFYVIVLNSFEFEIFYIAVSLVAVLFQLENLLAIELMKHKPYHKVEKVKKPTITQVEEPKTLPIVEIDEIKGEIEDKIKETEDFIKYEMALKKQLNDVKKSNQTIARKKTTKKSSKKKPTKKKTKKKVAKKKATKKKATKKKTTKKKVTKRKAVKRTTKKKPVKRKVTKKKTSKKR